VRSQEGWQVVSYTGPLRPTAKPLKLAPKKRWTANGALLLFDGTVALLCYWEKDDGQIAAKDVVKALNRHGVTLRAPKARMKGKS
jgi:hypothetical protein